MGSDKKTAIPEKTGPDSIISFDGMYLVAELSQRSRRRAKVLYQF